MKPKPPRKWYDDAGLPRMILKPPHARANMHARAHFVDEQGRRVDRRGYPVHAKGPLNFMEIDWDLDPPEEAPLAEMTDGQKSVGDLLTHARKSSRLLSTWAEALILGMRVVTQKGNATPFDIPVDTSQVKPGLDGAALLARALSGTRPALPKLASTKRDEFVEHNTRASVLEEGERLFLACEVRDEVFFARGPDIGVFGLGNRGLDAYRHHRMGKLGLEETHEALGRSAVDSEGRPLSALYKALWQRTWDWLYGASS